MEFNLITPWTENKKLGSGVATSYRPVGDSALGLGTCPSKCPLLPANGGGCYTRKFLVNNQQRNSWNRNDDFDKFLAKGATLVRLHTSGDFFTSKDGATILDTPYLQGIVDWSKKNEFVTVYTYTHDVSKLIEEGFTYANGSFSKNLHIVASCDSLEEKELALKHGFRTARVIESKDEKMADETLCPYDLALHEKNPKRTNCADCRLCFNPKHRNNIVFLKH